MEDNSFKGLSSTVNSSPLDFISSGLFSSRISSLSSSSSVKISGPPSITPAAPINSFSCLVLDCAVGEVLSDKGPNLGNLLDCNSDPLSSRLVPIGASSFPVGKGCSFSLLPASFTEGLSTFCFFLGFLFNLISSKLGSSSSPNPSKVLAASITASAPSSTSLITSTASSIIPSIFSFPSSIKSSTF